MSSTATFQAPDDLAPAPRPVPALPTETAEAFLRRFIPRSMKGPGWDALIAALASGIEPARKQGSAAFDQLHLASATDSYLDRRAAGEGMDRPRDVGMDDDTFREFVIAIATGKLTIPAFLEVLELFYGTDSTRAHLTSGEVEPFTLSGGETLKVTFDDKRTAEVVFSASDFATPGAATAVEVASALNRTLATQEVRALALPTYDAQSGEMFVTLYTGTRGLRGSIKVDASGGAAALLGFVPGRATVYSNARPAYVKTAGNNTVEVVMPATTDVVARQDGEAAYVEEDAGDDGSGPYVYDEVQGLPLTETTGVTSQSLYAGRVYKLLALTGAVEFPDEPGYLVIGLGYDHQAAYVPYLGRASSTQLLLDPSFRFTADIPAGAPVVLLDGRSTPDETEAGCYVTPSAAGRVACLTALDDISAAGATVKARIIYPSDEGLGYGGKPVEGARLISDIVRVFAGDDIDAEVAAAQGSS